MRYVRQILIIMVICFIGELLRYIIPLPIPASIYGMVLMFAALMTGIIKVAHIRETAQFLIDTMPLMFIPAGVGLITAWDAISGIWIQIVLISIISTILVMGVAGRVTQRLQRNMKREGKENE